MKTQIRASLESEFLRYHEDDDNYARNQAGFDAMYDILSKYGSEEERVDEVFKRATLEDQQKMVELITPGPRHPGDRGYAQKLYYDALEGEYGTEYGRGMVDAIEALMAEGWISESEFRTDL